MKKKKKPFIDARYYWTFIIPLVSNIVINTASALSNISKKTYFILLGIWIMIFVVSIITGEVIHHSAKKRESSELEIANILQNIINSSIVDKNIVLEKRTFDEHKTHSGAQEATLSSGDSIRIIASTLTYDLDMKSIEMIAKNIFKGVQYEYLLEMTQLNISHAKKLRNAIYSIIADMQKEGLSRIQEGLKFYLHAKNKYMHNFVLMCRANKSDIDHYSFYFIKSEGERNYIFEMLFDDKVEEVESLIIAYNLLKGKSVYFNDWV